MVGSRDLPPSNTSFWGWRGTFSDNQFRTTIQLPPPGTDLSSKTALVTGANVGLGLEACRQLLDIKIGRLILAVRSSQRGEEAARQLRVKYPAATIEVSLLDMSDYQSIQAFVQRCSQLPQLDIAILNAGVMSFKRSIYISPTTNHEDTLQVNYISTVLLTTLLLPLLKRMHSPGSPGRLTIVGTSLCLIAEPPPKVFHKDASIFAALDDPKTWNAQVSYRVSKVFQHMFLWKLVDYISAEDVIVNIADPGWAKGTKLHREIPAVFRPLEHLVGAFAARTVQLGTSCILDAAVTQGAESHGTYLMSYRIHPFASMLYTPQGRTLIERLWEETMDELAFADVRGILQELRNSP